MIKFTEKSPYNIPTLYHTMVGKTVPRVYKKGNVQAIFIFSASCGGDSNSKAGCGVNCNKHCSDIGKEPGFCITICYENACDCKEGFYYDDNTNKCVLPKDCSKLSILSYIFE